MRSFYERSDQYANIPPPYNKVSFLSFFIPPGEYAQTHDEQGVCLSRHAERIKLCPLEIIFHSGVTYC